MPLHNLFYSGNILILIRIPKFGRNIPVIDVRSVSGASSKSGVRQIVSCCSMPECFGFLHPNIYVTENDR